MSELQCSFNGLKIQCPKQAAVNICQPQLPDATPSPSEGSPPKPSSDMENQLNLINDRPSPSNLPVSSSSSAYPYFTSPNVDLSAQYYGSYSSNDGMFSSKTLQPSRSRNLKSRSHTGKIDNLVFYQELIWWWFSISFNAQVHTI